VPSAIDPPAGCHLHLRCPYVIERCRVERPLLAVEAGRATACHRWTELPSAGAAIPADLPSPALERLIAAFASSMDAPADSGVDTVDSELTAGRAGPNP
jgi:hypothetical protein